MIIELFGPPGVGKSTFARELTVRLRQRGQIADLVSSHRPTENTRSSGHFAKSSFVSGTAVVVRRLTRPAGELLAEASHLLTASHEAETVTKLLRMFPPRNLFWAIRLRQYLLRLLRSWQRESLKRNIVLFDQGFVQAVCSLVLLGRRPDRSLTGRALDVIPKPDLLIRLDASTDVIEARLRQRLRSRAERLFEVDLATNLRQVAIIDDLHQTLLDREQYVVCIDCADRHSLSEAIGRIGREVIAKVGQNPDCGSQCDGG